MTMSLTNFNFFKQILNMSLTNGTGFVMSGFVNATGEDKTDELAGLIYRMFGSSVLIFPSTGIWEGVPERSLVVIFVNQIDKSEAVTITEIVRLLTEKYQQIASVTFHNGLFWLRQPKAQIREDENIRIGNSFNTDFQTSGEGAPQGYTVVYVDEARTLELIRFTITDSDPLITAESVEQAKAMSATA